MSLLQMSFCGAVMILAIVLIRAASVERLPKRTFLMLWGVVTLRLLIPVEIPSQYSLYTMISYEFQADATDAGQRVNAAGAKKLPEALASRFAEACSQAQGQKLTETEKKVSIQKPALPRKGIDGKKTQVKEAEDQAGAAVLAKKDARFSEAAGRGWKMIALIVWAAGAFCCAMFFFMAYLRCRKEFSTSLPVQNTFVKRWMQERYLRQKHSFLRRLHQRIDVRVSDRIDTPLAYGIFCPVILLPKEMEWENEMQLEYVLWHEYLHICHFDTTKKLWMMLVLSIHWFNPFVWLMYLLLGRDIELACDESVLRKRGIKEKTSYAYMLIGMVAKKSAILPLYNGFGKNAIEKRIRAIMKIRKCSAGAVAMAAGLVISITLVFATSAVSASGTYMQPPSFETDFTQEEYEKIQKLCWEGYEDMSVAAYRDRVLQLISTEEYWELLERFYTDQAMYSHRDSDETSAFVFYVLKPLTSQQWEEEAFCADLSDSGDSSEADRPRGLDGSITLKIMNGTELTVGEYAAASRGVIEELDAMLGSFGPKQRADEEFIEKKMQKAADELTKKWSNYKLWVDVSFHEYLPNMENIAQQSEPCAFAGREEYASILSLMEPGYKQMSLAEFNKMLWDWNEENPGVYNKIVSDGKRGVFYEELSEEEKEFLEETIMLSAIENSIYGQGYYIDREINSLCLVTDNDEKQNQRAQVQICLLKKTKDGDSKFTWSEMRYSFSYQISDQESVTVGERDRCIGGIMDEMQAFWDDTDLKELFHITSGDVGVRMNESAKKYGGKGIAIFPYASWKQIGWSE